MIELVELRQIAIRGGLVGGPFGSSLVSQDYTTSGVPVIRGNNLSDRKYLRGDYVFVSDDKLRRDLRRNVAQPGDLIFTQRGTLGQVSLVPDEKYREYVVSQSQMRLRVDSTIAISEYVYYACRSREFLQQLGEAAIATGVPHINLGILSRLKVPLPSPAKQLDIADVLGVLDDKIAGNEILAKTCQDLALLLGSQSTRRVPLSEIVNVSRISRQSSDLSRDQVWHYSLPAFDQTGQPLLDNRGGIKSAKLAISAPCVLISKLNPRFPRVWNVPRLREGESVASTEFLVLEPADCSTGVLWAVLSQPSFRSILEGKVSGTSGSHQRVRPADLLATEVCDPRSISAVTRDQISELCDLVFQLGEESAHLAELRDILLPPLISGRLCVRDAEKQVEEVV